MTWYIVLSIVGVGIAAFILWKLMGPPPNGTRSSQEPWWRDAERSGWWKKKKGDKQK